MQVKLSKYQCPCVVNNANPYHVHLSVYLQFIMGVYESLQSTPDFWEPFTFRSIRISIVHLVNGTIRLYSFSIYV